MDRDELALFAAGLDDAAARHSGPDLDAAIGALGWRDALVDDPRVIAAMFTAQGTHGAASSAIDDVLVAAVGLEPGLAIAVVLPPLGIATHRALTATELVIAADTPYVVPASSVDRRAITGMDAAGGWVEIAGAPTTGSPTPRRWDAALPVGRLALATELTALSRAMLAMGRTHAVERIQFGRPIGSFQAVRHRLADAYLAVESADAAVSVGWDDPTPYAAAMVKAIAGRTAKTVSRHVQQVLAGMGFTAEHRFHLLMKRSMMLDQLLGAGATLSLEAARQAVAERAVPPMLAL
jgi:hypothetical protein